MDTKRISYHEAGHVIVSLALGLPAFEKVTVDPEDKRYLGLVDHGEDRSISSWAETIKVSMFSMAGGIAEAKYSGLSIEQLAMQGGLLTDMYQIATIIHGLISDNIEKSLFLGWIDQRTKIVIDTRWKEVEKVALALETKRTLSYKECRELVGLK